MTLALKKVQIRVLALNKQTQAFPETKYTWNSKKTSTQLWVPLPIHLAAAVSIYGVVL